MIRAVVFDIDGTLVDHVGAERAALRNLYQCIAETIQCPSVDDFISVWHAETEHYMELYLAGQLTFSQQRQQRVQSIFAKGGQVISDEQAGRVFQRYLTQYEQHWSLYGDVLPCLTSLKSRRLGVISNGDSNQQKQKLIRMGIRQFFSSVVISGDTGIAKPSPEIFERSARELKLSPASIVYVGDNLKHDAVAASEAGLHGVWLDRNGAAPTPHGVTTITDLTEVPHLIEGMN